MHVRVRVRVRVCTHGVERRNDTDADGATVAVETVRPVSADAAAAV
jgi:hypothetical protein